MVDAIMVAAWVGLANQPAESGVPEPEAAAEAEVEVESEIDFEAPADPDAPLPPSLQERHAAEAEEAELAAALEGEDVPEGVDVFDESTWVELSVEEKDRMRAIRQRVRLKMGRTQREQQQRRQQEEAAELAVAQDEAYEALGPAKRHYGRSDWEVEDARLERMQVGWGVTFALGIVAAAGSVLFAGLRTNACKAGEVEPTPWKCGGAGGVAVGLGVTFAVVGGTGLTVVSVIRNRH